VSGVEAEPGGVQDPQPQVAAALGVVRPVFGFIHVKQIARFVNMS